MDCIASTKAYLLPPEDSDRPAQGLRQALTVEG
ncbi:hypothetical protein ruthe_02945 [Rubellimicrobium thermophilum DSM 16684]|uniref:Uncharacterized protein n=1 Tax=Rubellimicrobium thermophilum DSM 16684 TaxID=1123069 RepID=S9SAN0_9RHOB|nr:hypothetical protein ruthe_02945 [Rubellimicrobium thermophilum DSM 16684]